MSCAVDAFHSHAEAVLAHELGRARGRLASLPCDRRLAVEELSARVAGALVEGVLEQARTEPSVAQALVSIYAGEPAWELAAVPCPAD